jgi:hypothetical protein
MKQKLIISSIVGLLFSIMTIFLNVTGQPKIPANITLSTKTIQICGRNFTTFEITKSPGPVLLAKKPIIVTGLSLPMYAPYTLVNDSGANLVVEISGAITYPLAPDVPILPQEEQNKACDLVKLYADKFPLVRNALVTAHDSTVFKMTPIGNSLGVEMQANYQNVLAAETNQTFAKSQSLKTMVEGQYKILRTRPSPTYDFLIVYQNGYQTEVSSLVTFYNQRKIRTYAIELSSLPGYNANASIPAECNGEFLKECYHFWGDPVPGVSQLSVPSLPGYVAQTSAFSQYTKVSYVPGLIRAYVRAMKKNHPLKGLLLIGSPEKIPPFRTTSRQYYYDGIPWLTNSGAVPSGRLFTDLYFSLPDVALVQDNSQLSHEILSPNIWSCSGPNGIRLGYFCNNDEWRHWPEPPLTAYRNPPHVPQGKIFSLKYGFSNPYWNSLSYADVLPVGRLVTQDRILGGKDPSVARYVAKLKRWYNELPSISHNSIASMGGSTGDTWIYTKEDIDQFKTTFGSNSKVYASEFFVPSSKCAGRCLHEPAEYIMNSMGQKNSSAFFLNGHGGHIAIQGPYANGDVSSHYLNEGPIGLNDGLRLAQINFPDDTTLKIAENQQKLIGVIFANSCSPSDYNLSNEMAYIYHHANPNSDQKSWAEQWIGMNNAGALNTFLNGNVGWGGSDNAYNVAYMKRLKTAWSNCGNIGDAHRMLILDGLRNGSLHGIGSWQLYNRHLLGSPLNHFARLPMNCSIVVGDPILVEANKGI